MKHTLIIVIAWAIIAPDAAAQSQPAGRGDAPAASRSRVHKLDELAWPQIDALERERTLFILPIGMIEQHGPHLPVGADTIGVTYEANVAATRISRALPGWSIVMMPPLAYGHSGANQIGDMPIHPGTYAIRQATLRSVVADVGAQIAQNRFKWIFVLNGHGAPTHNIAINEACDFVSETFGVTMLHVTGLFKGDAAIQAQGAKIDASHFSPAELSSFGVDFHAGVGETSGMLAVRPDLVRPNFKSLPNRAARSVEEFRAVATTPGWQGYVSAPARATAAYGRAVEGWWIDGVTDLIVRSARGENMFTHPRFPETVPEAAAAFIERELTKEAAFAATLDNWLAQRRKR